MLVACAVEVDAEPSTAAIVASPDASASSRAAAVTAPLQPSMALCSLLLSRTRRQICNISCDGGSGSGADPKVLLGGVMPGGAGGGDGRGSVGGLGLLQTERCALAAAFAMICRRMPDGLKV